MSRRASELDRGRTRVVGTSISNIRISRRNWSGVENASTYESSRLYRQVLGLSKEITDNLVPRCFGIVHRECRITESGPQSADLSQ